MSEEKCQRCGEPGPDLRWLWMACLYDMTELGLPLSECEIEGVYKERIGEEGVTYRVPVFQVKEGAERRGFRFYQLRVCKTCRAEWMYSIKNWFGAPRHRDDGSGCYVRWLGATIESRQEVENAPSRSDNGHADDGVPDPD